MKHRIFGAMTLLATIFLSSCDKEDKNKVFDVNFYTTKASGKMVLYIDQVEQGTLAYFTTPPNCGQLYSDGARPIRLQLKSGEYQISGKNEHGVVTSLGIVKIGENKMHTSGRIGGISVAKNDDCVSIGLFE